MCFGELEQLSAMPVIYEVIDTHIHTKTVCRKEKEGRKRTWEVGKLSHKGVS